MGHDLWLRRRPAGVIIIICDKVVDGTGVHIKDSVILFSLRKCCWFRNFSSVCSYEGRTCAGEVFIHNLPCIITKWVDKNRVLFKDIIFNDIFVWNVRYFLLLETGVKRCFNTCAYDTWCWSVRRPERANGLTIRA